MAHALTLPAADDDSLTSGGRPYYSISEAAALLGVSRVSIWRWIRSGRLPATRLGHRTIRVARADLERLLRPAGSAAAASRTEAAERPFPRIVEIGRQAHAVRIHETDELLVEEVTAFVATGLRAGSRCVLVTSPAHRAALEQGLAGAGLDLTAATATDRYVWLDAAETLARFMVDGLPDPERFVEAIEPVVADPIGGGREVRVFGEMVALLASAGDYAAAVRLEGLWNSLRDRHGFTLFCAYPISSFDADRSGRQLEAVCAAHSQVIPAESYTALAEGDDRAREIASLQRKARRLEAEIREREQAVRLRDEFLSVASHELRTPLTTISAHAQVMLRRLLRDSSADPATVQRSFEVIVEQSGKLARLVSQLLDVSRLQGGKLTLERRPTELRGLVERVAAAVAMGSGQPIEVQAPEAVTARVDPLRLDQLLTNLLDNAVKYGASEGPIAVELARRAGAIEIAVRDHGPGIPPDQRARVFERFFQAHTDSYASGMGLGLYIARQIAELHGGALRAEFPPDGGSRFVLTLPSA